MARGDDAVTGHPDTTAPNQVAPAHVQRARVEPAQRAHLHGVTIGDTAAVHAGPALLRLLMQRWEGHDHPLGRDIHPMTTVPMGVAIDAAIEACGGYALGVTTLRYATLSLEAPVSMRRTLSARATVRVIGRRHIEVECVVTEDRDAPRPRGDTEVERLRVIMQTTVGLVRLRNGRASVLDDLDQTVRMSEAR